MTTYPIRHLLAGILFCFITTGEAWSDNNPWASVEPYVRDTSNWPEVTLLLKIRDLDSYGGDSHSYDTSLPNPLNPDECNPAQLNTEMPCWRVVLSAGGRKLPVLRQQTILSLNDLRRQYLWLAYRAEPGIDESTELHIDLSLKRYGGEEKVLKPGSGLFDLRRIPEQKIATSPMDLLLRGAQNFLDDVDRRQPQRQKKSGLSHYWGSFVERDCLFQTMAGLNDQKTCRYYHLRARLEAEREEMGAN